MRADEQLQTLETTAEIPSFDTRVGSPLVARGIDILQINVGARCNLSCKHCHVQAGPYRSEQMSKETMEQCLRIVADNPIATIDVTGGAPEMNPHLDWFLTQASALDRRLIVRTNLVVLLDPIYRRFADLYAHCRVEVVGSLPGLSSERVDRMRGNGAFAGIIEALRLLNGLGYGDQRTGLMLDIVHNPVGAVLPGAQQALEREFRRRLHDEHSVTFSRLFSLTNCPVGRYLDYLVRSDNYAGYMDSLCRAYNATAADNAMCRNMVSVGWDGALYDCDFNQMLGLPIGGPEPRSVSQFDFERLAIRRIAVGNHCYACTAGSGSSCQGATSS
jgi:radical SAM/Cys-rich protein